MQLSGLWGGNGELAEMLDLSVVIVNYNSGNLLRGCLESLFKEISNLSPEVFVVDNSSKDGSEAVVGEFPQVNLIENRSNLGFARAANKGIRRSKGRYVLLLNPDTILLHRSLGELVRFMDERPEAGVGGAKLLYPDGRLQLSCRRFPEYSFLLFGRESILTRLFPKNRFSRQYMLTDLDYDRVQEVDFEAGAAMIVRRSIFEEIGYLDEDFFLFAEDTDLCFRAKNSGWKVYFIPQAQIVHHLGASVEKEKGRAVLEHHKSIYNFLLKHYHPPMWMKMLLRVGLTFKIIALLATRAWNRGG